MTSPAPAPASVRALRWMFGDVVLDERRLELTLRGQVVQLEPKPLQLLLHLLRHAGEVVTKEELHENVWPSRVLSESVLTKTMAKLRQGLGDEDQSLIKTVHGYGYKLAVPVRVEAAEASAPRVSESRKVGDAIPQRPHWQLKQALGSGGLGEVWLGAHAATGEQRVFKFAFDAAGLTGLKREITLHRVLRASLGERPDFVRLMDYNLEEAPYFLESEYLAGGDLRQWIEAQGGFAQVPLAQRLSLLAQVAESLAAAHGAGVLHKDLKPGNVLIGRDPQGQPQPKLADFGSGRMVDLARLEQLEITRLGFTQTLLADEDSTSGTPLYLAPELLAGQQPTAQADIYALGVILYQMIVGDLRRPLAVGWEQEIDDALLREDVALAAAGHCQQRLSDALELSRRLRSLPARRENLEKKSREEQARTEAQQQLRQTQQENEKLRARRRALLVTLAVLVTGLASSLWLYRNAQRSKQQAELATVRAEQSANDAEAISGFLYEDILTSLNIDQHNLRSLSVEAWLDQAASQVSRRFGDNPQAASQLHLGLSRAYETVAADNDKPLRQTQLALALARDHFKRQPDIALKLAEKMAGRLHREIQRDDLSFWKEVESLATQRWGVDDRRHLALALELATADYRVGDRSAGLRRLEQLVAKIRVLQKPQPDLLRAGLLHLAGSYMGVNQLAQSEAHYLEAFALDEAQKADSPSGIVERAAALGGLYSAMNRNQEADTWIDRGMAQLSLRAAPDDYRVDDLRVVHAIRCLYRNWPCKTGEAVGLLEAAHAKALRRFGPEHEAIIDTGTLLSNAYQQDGRFREAVPLREQTLALKLRHRDPEGLDVAHTRLRLAEWYLQLGDNTALGKLLESISATPPKQMDNKDIWLGEWARLRGLLAARQGQATAARQHLEEALKHYDSVQGADSDKSRALRQELSRLGNSPSLPINSSQ